MRHKCAFCEEEATGGLRGPTILGPEIRSCGQHAEAAAYAIVRCLNDGATTPADPLTEEQGQRLLSALESATKTDMAQEAIDDLRQLQEQT